ncbi:MAG TPA: metal-dependent hydrolase [Burkholderiales bacterium]|nr:metal-dependent hydrolase [Burkholderiales bacterium]
MDTLTHALSGALLAGAVARAEPASGEPPPRAQMAAGFAAAAFPDADFVLRAVDTLTYLNGHQGLTHSILLLPLWAVALAYVFGLLARGRYRWHGFILPAVLGIAAHIAGDAITAYGPMLLAPLSTQRFSVPIAFVVDPWFSAIVAAGLAGALFLPWRRRVAASALAALACYAAFLGVLHSRVAGEGKAYAIVFAMPHAEVHVLPQPFSPFNWKIVLRERERYLVADVNLRRGPWQPVPAPEVSLLKRMSDAYQPVWAARWMRYSLFGEDPADTGLAREAWNDTALAGFRRFAMFPAFVGIQHADGQTCARFLDLRFVLPELPASFRYQACRDEAAAGWNLQRVRGTFWLD